jgi:glycosyltransferase involved in cell wall biosynthesis
MPPEVSVVLPTYNRRDRLLGCLRRLAAQTLAPDRFEVVVISDGSSDGTAAAARAAADGLPFPLTVIEAPHGGPGSARNHGIARARAPVIAFVDDDVEVDPSWLAAGLAPFADPDLGGVEGRTEAVLGDDSLYTGNVSNPDGGIYPTCNIFYRKSALEEAGGFDLAFQRAREDSDLAFRILARGHRIAFEPRALARHRSHRRTVLLPLQNARALPDTVRLHRKHPGRDRLRTLVYGSDLAKIALVIAAVVALAAGHATIALACAAVFAALVARTMLREVVFPRALRPDRLLGLVAVYAILPFAHLFYLGVGLARAR